MRMLFTLLILVCCTIFTPAQTNKLNDILEKSVRNIDKIKTLKGCYYVSFGSVIPGDTASIAQLSDQFIIKRKADDSLCRIWFKEDIVNLLDTTQKYQSCYNGRHFYNTFHGNSEEQPLQYAKNAHVINIFNEIFRQTQSYLKKLTWPDSLYRLHEDTAQIDKISLCKDTLIDEESCYLIRNYKRGERPKFNIYYEYECLLAISKKTFLPIWLQIHHKRNGSDHTPLGGQVRRYWLTHLKINPYINDRTFFPKKLNIKQPVKITKLNKGEEIPNWKTKTLHGKNFSKLQLHSQVYVMAFSYIACTWCQFALPELISIQHKYANNPHVKIFYLDCIDGSEHLKNYAKEKSLALELCSVKPEFTAQLGVQAYPHYYVIDKEGKITTVIQGYPGEKGKLFQQLEKSIEEALSK